MKGAINGEMGLKYGEKHPIGVLSRYLWLEWFGDDLVEAAARMLAMGIDPGSALGEALSLVNRALEIRRRRDSLVSAMARRAVLGLAVPFEWSLEVKILDLELLRSP
jgi:hypothetical protein